MGTRERSDDTDDLNLLFIMHYLSFSYYMILCFFFQISNHSFHYFFQILFHFENEVPKVTKGETSYGENTLYPREDLIHK